MGKPKKSVYDLWKGIRLKDEGYFFRHETYGHPGYTPDEIFTKAIDIYTDEGEIILDPFLGTGTSAVSAKYLKCKSIGIEISKEYCDIAVKRLRQEVLL
jgi:site-specific DNA-methyltransferase (adenine-specific)